MTDNVGDRSDSNRRVSRRSYLTAAAGTAGLLAAGSTMVSAQEEYDVVEVPAGGTYRRKLGNGDTLENVLIDISARGAGYDIQAKGSDWTIRNVGVRGAWDRNPGRSPFRVSADAGSTCRIENVYLGDGVIPDLPATSNPTGIYVYWFHAGTIEIDRVAIEEHPDNGIYGSAPGNSNDHPNPGGNGDVRVTNSYVRGGKVAGIRLGTDGSYAKNCVMWNNTHRGYWGFYNDTKLVDCDLGGSATDIHSGSGSWKAGANSTVTVENCRFNSTNTAGRNNGVIGESVGKPEFRIPDGAPTVAEDAASGGASGATQAVRSTSEPKQTPSIEELWMDGSNHLIFTGGLTNQIAEYRITGEGNAEYGDGANTNADDQYRETISTDGDTFVIEGYLGGGSDDLYVDGTITSVDVDADVSTTLNDTGIETSDLEGVGSWETVLDNTILVDGVGTGDTTRYEFTVSGAAEPSTYKGASIDDEDTIDSGTITGSIAGWRDAFRFDGELEELTIDGPARVYVNDEQVDPSDYGESQPHTLTIVGNGSDATYEVTVDGTIALTSDDLEQYAAVVSETTAEGSIQRGVQRFQFSGALTDITFLNGSAHVYVDDERIDPDTYGDQELLPNAIVFDGTTTDGATSYSFTVDGEVITASYRDASIDSNDEIDGRSVSGSVDDSLDAYWFDGDIVDFKLAGNANVDVEYDTRGQ